MSDFQIFNPYFMSNQQQTRLFQSKKSLTQRLKTIHSKILTKIAHIMVI